MCHCCNVTTQGSQVRQVHKISKQIPQKRKFFFCMNDQGMLWTICQSDSHIASTSEERRRFQSFLLTRTTTQWPKSISNKDNRFGHVDWIHRKHSRWTGLYSKVDWCKTWNSHASPSKLQAILSHRRITTTCGHTQKKSTISRSHERVS